MGTHPALAELDEAELARRRRPFTPAWASPTELARRGIGSAYVLARSLMRGPGPYVPRPLQRAKKRNCPARLLAPFRHPRLDRGSTFLIFWFAHANELT